MRVLITGGAGFIGQHVVRYLSSQGLSPADIHVLDNLDPQAHPDLWESPPDDPCEEVLFPEALRSQATCHLIDLVELDDVLKLLRDEEPFDAVIHLAARVGVGQSATDPAAYVRDNVLGTANLLQALQDARVAKPARLVYASSMSCYGEGAYRVESAPDSWGQPTYRYTDEVYIDRRRANYVPREIANHLTASLLPATPVPTPEGKPLRPTSIYAETKATAERMVTIWGHQQDVRVAPLRFFNVFGPGQSTRNPYTGVLAIFVGRALQGLPPLIYDDGQQTRDFVPVGLVASVVGRIALGRLGHRILRSPTNVGLGLQTSIWDVAQIACEAVAEVTGEPPLRPTVTRQHRAGDIRQCHADIERLRSLVGASPEPEIDRLLDPYGAVQALSELLREAALGLAREVYEGRVGRNPIGDAHQELVEAGLIVNPSELDSVPEPS